MTLRLENVIDWNMREVDGRYQLTIEMDYLPTLSVNRYKTVRGITRREVDKWMEELAFIIRTVNAWNNDIRPPIKVRLDGVFKDKRYPDMHNLLKVVCDAVEDGLGINDKLYTTECGQPEIGEPKIIITISEDR